jgi:hypothetical protein
MFIRRCEIRAAISTLQSSTKYSNSSHVRRNCELSTIAMACEIRSRRDCGFGGCYTWSFIYPHMQKSHWVRSGDRGTQGMGVFADLVSWNLKQRCAFCTRDSVFLFRRQSQRGQEKNLCPYLEPNLNSSAIQPVAQSLYYLSCPGFNRKQNILFWCFGECYYRKLHVSADNGNYR